MRKLALAAAALLWASALAAQETASPNLPDLPDLPGLEDLPEPTRYLAGYVAAAGGWSAPFGGHWGDGSSGFKPSQAFSLSALRRVDEVLGYGLESGYAWNHLNRDVAALKVKVFYLTPFVRVSFPSGETVYYGTLGAGVYQWSQPAYEAVGTRYPSDSGSSAGMNLGAGVSYPFWFGTRLGVDLRWHRIFNMKGSNLKLDTADSINAMVVLHYGVWRERGKK